jgi:hypothetical protein
VLLQNDKNELNYLTAEQLSITNKKNLKLLKKANWEGVNYETIKIDAIPNNELFNG